ncbi:hypothetical protein RN001_002739 [Aquatica leii]|uniref:Mitochondrial inner membrane protease subunit n=1 Tax=Aquatica leii TaxID=1421715 RepID=A0AAN7SRC6_9COLE|nr:hypothetical protein RN001_002739 [Aquatica leii]
MQVFIKKTLKTLGYVIQYGCIAHCVFKYLGDIVVCSGDSMEPTVYSNDVVIIEHISPRCKNIENGDVVIAKCPTNPKQYVCKRVIGLPGDRVKTTFDISHVVPRGHVWLEGDNKDNSSDSRVHNNQLILLFWFSFLHKRHRMRLQSH